MRHLLVFFLIDSTGAMGVQEGLFQEQMDRLLQNVDQLEKMRSHLTLSNITMGAAPVHMVQRLGANLPVRAPGCQLGLALEEMEKALAGERNPSVEVFVLLNSEPSGDWKARLRALKNKGVQFTAVAFAPSRGMGAPGTSAVSDETLMELRSKERRPLRVELNEQGVAGFFSHAYDILYAVLTHNASAAPTPGNRVAPVRPLSPAPAPPAPAPGDRAAHVQPPAPPPASPAAAGDQPRPPEDMPRPEPPAQPVTEGPALAPQETPPPAADGPEAAAGEPPAVPPPHIQEAPAPTAAGEVPSPTIAAEEELAAELLPADQAPADETAAPDDEELALRGRVTVPAPQPPPQPPPVTKEGVATGWREVEPPADDPDWVAHTAAHTMPGVDNWLLVGASRRGKMHAHKGIFREDAFATGQAAGWHLMVVADGGGSCPLSRVGSQLAADTAVEVMGQFVTKMARAEMDPAEVAQLALNKGMRAAYERLDKEAQDRGRPLKDLGTTFLAVVHQPAADSDVVGVLQVGDGLVVAELADGAHEILAEPDVGETASVTLFLTSKPWKEWSDRAQVRQLKEQRLRLLAAMCDGVGDDLIPYADRLPIFFRLIAEKTKQAQPDEALLDWLGYDIRGSFDDRTVTLIYQAVSEAEAPPAPVPDEKVPEIPPVTLDAPAQIAPPFQEEVPQLAPAPREELLPEAGRQVDETAPEPQPAPEAAPRHERPDTPPAALPADEAPLITPPPAAAALEEADGPSASEKTLLLEDIVVRQAESHGPAAVPEDTPEQGPAAPADSPDAAEERQSRGGLRGLVDKIRGAH